MDDGEYKRCCRVIDWMHTAHGILRDRYGRRAQGLTLGVMALSIVGLMFALANGDQQVSLLGINGKLQVLLAWIVALTFFLSLVDLVAGWRQKAWLHKDTAERLGQLRLLFRRAQPTHQGWGVAGVDLAAEYDRVMSALHPLPDRKVAALKARHNRKRARFALADDYPGAPSWWIRWRVYRDSFRGGMPSQDRGRTVTAVEDDGEATGDPTDEGATTTNEPATLPPPAS